VAENGTTTPRGAMPRKRGAVGTLARRRLPSRAHSFVGWEEFRQAKRSRAEEVTGDSVRPE